MRQIPRLFIAANLEQTPEVHLEGNQAHYLLNVLRLQPGDTVHLFDDQSGEWEAQVQSSTKRAVVLACTQHLRPREISPDLWLLAAPIRRERYEWIAEKATELGVACLQPVLTERTNRDTVRPDRLQSHMIEAAEQCERTSLPLLKPTISLSKLLEGWDPARTLYFADEEGSVPLADLAPSYPAALLIGPEGGFSEAERTAIKALASTRTFSLGPRILRADTAAVAAIAQFQLKAGW